MSAPPVALATVGTLAWYPPGTHGKAAKWGVTAVPHVMIRIKRLFPRVERGRTDEVLVSDTPDVARDLEMIHGRHPLAMSADVADRLAARCAEHVNRTQAIDDIMAGGTGLSLELDPARPLRDYQAHACRLFGEVGRVVLGDELGLGKTTTALGMLGDPSALPALIVCPTHLRRQWVRELAAVWPLRRAHIVTKGTPYDLTRVRGANGYPPDVLIISYGMLTGWQDVVHEQYPTVIFDEFHELRGGTDTIKGMAAARVAAGARVAIGLTGTLICNYGDEVWNLYNVLHPDLLGERTEFLREWGGGTVGGHTKVADPAALGTFLREQGAFLRRTRVEVGREVPRVIPVEHEIDADTSKLAEVSKDVAAMARIVLNKAIGRQERATAGLQLEGALRQATGIAKGPAVAELARMVLEAEDNLIIWGWHRAVYDIWRDRLADYNPVLFTGDESERQKIAAVREFTSGASRVLFMSLRSGAGLDGLQHVCRTGMFGEYDWSPAIMGQCVGRINRDGQPHPVTVYYPTCDYGADPPMTEVLAVKSAQASGLLDPNAPVVEETPEEAIGRIEKLARHVLGQDRRSGKAVAA